MAWVMTGASWAVVAALALGGNPTPRPKPLIDKTKPVRMEQLFALRQGDREVAQVCSSSRLVLDDSAREQAKEDFHRILVRFVDGTRVAFYSIGDYRNPKFALVQTLMVDANEGTWVLLTARQKTTGPGYGALKAGDEKDGANPLVRFETRSLRLTPESSDAFPTGKGSEVLRTAEPQLVELLQKIRQAFPRLGDASMARAIPDEMARLLQLPDIAPCADCKIERLRHAIANEDDEGEPAAPLDPEFEAAFGKWASWRELPRLKGN